MKAKNWVKRLLKNERGNVLLIGVATMPLLLGSAAVSIDVIQLELWKRQIQRAADSASLAGAHALAQDASTGSAVANDLDEHVAYDLDNSQTLPVVPEVLSGSFAGGAFSTQTCGQRGVAACLGKTVQVTLRAQRTLPFISFFTGSANTIAATAVSAVVSEGEFCMISLYDQNGTGILARGNSELLMDCGMATRARSGTQAILVGGAGRVGPPAGKSIPVSAVGGISGKAKSFLDGTVLEPFSAPARDPFEHIPVPAKPTNCGTPLVVSNAHTDANPRELTRAEATCYTSWDIQGTVKLASNTTYYVDNSLLTLHGRIIGENVTIVFVGDNSDFKQNGGGKLEISAPTDGTYKGIALYRDRSAALKQFKINGGADIAITGAIYAPTSEVWLGGNGTVENTDASGDFVADCLQVVAWKLQFQGGGSITNKCENGLGNFKKPIIRLVS
jgi:Flp pilus assembly protein TadG